MLPRDSQSGWVRFSTYHRSFLFADFLCPVSSETNLKLRKALDVTAQLPEQGLAVALRGDLLEAELPNEYIYGFRGRYKRGAVCIMTCARMLPVLTKHVTISGGRGEVSWLRPVPAARLSSSQYSLHVSRVAGWNADCLLQIRYACVPRQGHQNVSEPEEPALQVLPSWYVSSLFSPLLPSAAERQLNWTVLIIAFILVSIIVALAAGSVVWRVRISSSFDGATVFSPAVQKVNSEGAWYLRSQDWIPGSYVLHFLQHLGTYL